MGNQEKKVHSQKKKKEREKRQGVQQSSMMPLSRISANNEAKQYTI